MRKKGIEALRVKHPTLSRVIDALIGDEEQSGKEKKEKQKKQRAVPNSATHDNSVSSCDA